MKNDVVLRYKRIIIVLIIVIVCLCSCFGIILYKHISNDEDVHNMFNNLINRRNNNINKRLFDSNISYDEQVHNSFKPLHIDDGNGVIQGTHPKVLYFKDGFNGYKYYMVYTPYPYGNDKYENPSIVVSNDMINWSVPEGLKNPIANVPSNYKSGKVYNSDPHLVYNSDLNILECYYRFVDDTKNIVIIYRLKSKDGVNWNKKEEILKGNRFKKDYLSPSIIYDNGVYKMWYVFKNKVYYIESNDGVNYSNPRVINIKYYAQEKLKTWHIDVIKSDLGYEMIMVAYNDWKSRKVMSLYYTVSSDNKNYMNAVSIIRPSNVSWDNRGLYRSSFIKDENGVYYVFYSGISKKAVRGIGLSYGSNINNLIGSKTK